MGLERLPGKPCVALKRSKAVRLPIEQDLWRMARGTPRPPMCGALALPPRQVKVVSNQGDRHRTGPRLQRGEFVMLGPIIALVAWTLVVWLWMYATRIPAMQQARIDPQDARHPGALETLPPQVRQVADNYNHLHEQPTIFYAVALAIHAGGWSDPLFEILAWSYVGLRVLHSLVQGTFNIVTLRFAVFAAASLVLMVMTVRVLPVAIVG